MSVILTVEDNLSNLQLLRATLEDRGHEVFEALTLAAAREYLRFNRCDLVLLDLSLPDGNGLDLLREIRANTATASMPVVVVSAWALPHEREAAQREGCSMFVAKPIKPVGLADVVARLLSVK